MQRPKEDKAHGIRGDFASSPDPSAFHPGCGLGGFLSVFGTSLLVSSSPDVAQRNPGTHRV
jgi:hypothetical protein